MRILVKGEILPNLEILDELKIVYDYNENGVTLYLPETAKIAKNADNKYLKNKKAPSYYNELLANYSESEDNSLANFVIKNHKIIASGNISQDEKNNDLYICNGDLRVYTKTDIFTTYNLISAGNFSSYDLADFYEAMLKDSTIKQQGRTR